MLSSTGVIPYRRLTDPLALSYGPASQRTVVPAGYIPAEATSFQVYNRGNAPVRLKGARGAAASNLTIKDGEGWLFPPGFRGTFTTQYPEAMATISVEANGVAAGSGILEISYGVGGAGESVAALVAVGGSTGGNVTVTNFPAVQPVSDNGGSLTVDGSVSISNFPATQPVSGTVSVGNFPASQAVSGSVSVSNFPATQQVSDAGGSLTIDTGTAGVFSPTPTGLAAYGIVPQVSVGQASMLVRAAAGNLYSASVVAATNAPAFYLIALNRTSVPSANAAITAAEMMGCQYIFAGSYGSLNPDDIPDRFTTGIVLICSTSTTTYTPPNAGNILHLKARAA